MRTSALIAAATAMLAVSSPVAAQEDSVPPWYNSITVNGMVEVGMTLNLNDPPSRRNALRVFDYDHGTFKLDAAELVVQRDGASDGVGFRLDVAIGSSIPKVTRSAGLLTGDLDIHQAFLSYSVPAASGLRVDVGKFVTPAGHEVIDGYDGINDNVSRSVLFGYAIPFTHTGLRAGIAPLAGLAATAYLVNGWDIAVDNNSTPTVGLHVLATGVEGLTLAGCVFHGPERDTNEADARTLVDLVAAWSPSELVTIGANADVARESGAGLDGTDASWSGLAGYLRLNLSSQFSLALRAEAFDDPDGLRTGVAQTVKSFTVTPELRPAEGLTLRAELRLDSSTKPVFEESDGEPSETQLTLGAQAVVRF